MGATAKRNWIKNPAVIVLFALFGLWIFWYFKIDENVDTKSLESGYIFPQLIQNTDNKTDHKIQFLMQKIKSLKKQNSNYNTSYQQLLNEKDKMQQQIEQLQAENNELNALNKKIKDLQEVQKNTEIKNSELMQQIKQLKPAESQQAVDSNDINYYFLYGYCNKKKLLDPHVYVIMDHLKAYISKQYTHWNILNISIQEFLIETNFSYTHDKLIQFTTSTIPYLDIIKDKFQWIFDPHCRGYYKDLKAYYHQNVSSTTTVKLPLDIYEYYNISKLDTKHIINQKKLDLTGYIDDDDRTDIMSHIVNINHHKYNNTLTGKQYYLDIPYTDRVLNVWQNNSYYSKDIEYPISLSNNRPFLMGLSGEAFDSYIGRKKFHCKQQDFHIQRTKSWPKKGCIVSHYVQGILQRDMEWDKEGIMDYNRLIISNKKSIRDEQVNKIIKNKHRFCSFTVKTLVVWGKYLGEALVRHVLHDMISTQYKYCDMLGKYHFKTQDKKVLCSPTNARYKFMKGTHHLLARCQQEFKFSINMENTASYGYTSEKLYTGLIADTVPIYFGNKEIDKLVNMDRIIFCDIDDYVLINKRHEYRKLFKKAKRKYGDVNTNGTASILVATVLRNWAIENYSPYLQSCVQEIIEVDKNDTLYKYKISQPKIPNNTFKNSHYDGTNLSKAIIDALMFLKSPLFDYN